MIYITKEQARRFILVKQGLLGAYRFKGKSGAYSYIKQAGCIQYDPVDVCGKNAELTLQSRVKGFSKQMLNKLLYEDRLVVDYCDKELSIWPSADWPCFKRYRDMSSAHCKQFSGMEELEKTALAWIKENGPVSSDTLPIEGTIFWHSSMHWSGHWHSESNAARSVLEQLYTDGELIIHHKNGSRKFYDLAEKYLDKELLKATDPNKDDASFIKWRIRRRIGAIGLLWNRRSDAWLGIDMTTKQRDAAFREMEEEGAIIPVQVEGIKDILYILAEDISVIDSVLKGTADMKSRLEFLAPLDPMLWDRRLIHALWDFQYSWEIYTPAEKRKFGYYALPMLYGDAFIGRIEAAVNKKTNTLLVKNVWFEPYVRQTKKLNTQIHTAVKRLARFNGCSVAEISSCSD